MSRGHNKGSGHHRDRGAWVAINRGRANKVRNDHVTVRCPHGGPHWVPTKSFLGHLNSCKAGLARTA